MNKRIFAYISFILVGIVYVMFVASNYVKIDTQNLLNSIFALSIFALTFALLSLSKIDKKLFILQWFVILYTATNVFIGLFWIIALL